MGFNFRVYPGKYHDKFLQKKKKRNAKSRIFGSSWAHFAQYWEKQTFPQISVLTTFVFLLILTKHYCVKFQKTND